MKTGLRGLVDIAAIVVLLVLALVPVSAAYASADFWIAAGGGIVLGAAIAAIGARLRWRTLSIAAITLVAYFVFGGALVFREQALFGVVPTLDVLSALAFGAVQVWKQALTLQAPFAGFAALGVAPLIAGLIGSVVGVSLALRLRRFGLALLAPALLLVGSIAYSTYSAFAPGAVGAAFAGVALGWAIWRLRHGRAAREVESGVARPGAGRRGAASLAVTAGVVVLAVVAGGAVATAAPLADRAVLRDHVVPPLELHDYASPLTSFRKYVTDGDKSTLFTVSGLPDGARMRLATLDLYDGVVYKVSGAGGAGSGVFSRVGRTIENRTEGETAHVQVQVNDLTSVWLPTAGYLSDLSYTGSDAVDRDASLHYNTATGTAVDTAGLRSGDAYEFDAVLSTAPSEEALENAQIAAVSMPAPAKVPDDLVSALDGVVQAAATPIEQVRAVEAYFQTEGYFSHGLEGQVTSRSGHGDSRESDLFTGSQMIGDDEQYSVAMSLMLSQLGIPSRVVMGFAGKGGAGLGAGTVSVNGDEVHAWVEVPLTGLGWVSFWPTPAEDKVPQQEVPQKRQKPKVQVAQPPETPQEPAELPPAPPIEEAQNGDQPASLAWLWTTLQISGIALIVLALLFGPSIVFAMLRVRRRRARSRAVAPADRMTGGWSELVDAAIDSGTALTPGATRREQGSALAVQYPDAGTTALAERADIAVFGGIDPSPDEVGRYWADVATATERIAKAQPLHRRLRARLFPASVIGRLRRPWRRTAGS